MAGGESPALTHKDFGLMIIIPWDGQQITKPGVYSGVPLERYHSGDICDGPSVSSSGLRTIFSISPAHYHAESPYNEEPDDEDDEQKAEKEAFVLGRAAHHLLLGEDDFSTQFIMRPDKAPYGDGRVWNGNNDNCRKWLIEQAKAGRTVLTPKQIKSIRGMARSLAAHPMVADGILNGGIELSIFWLDAETGCWCKARPDAIPTDSSDLSDLKTSIKYGEDLDREIFVNRRYDMQGEFVRWGIREVWKREVESFSLVFVEKKKPFTVDVVSIDMGNLDEAGDDLRIALRAFAWCYERNNWFGPTGSQQDARYARRSEWAKTHAMYRRDVLKREIGA